MDTVEIVETDATEETEEFSFAQEMLRATAIAAATTVGMIAGASAYGLVREKLEARKARKALKLVEEATDTTQE